MQLGLASPVTGGGVDDVVVVRVVELALQSCQAVLEDSGQARLLLVGKITEAGLMLGGHNPDLEGYLGCKGHEGQEGFVLGDDSLPLLGLLLQNIAVDAPARLVKVVLSPLFSPADVGGHHAGDYYLGVGMGQGIARRPPWLRKISVIRFQFCFITFT